MVKRATIEEDSDDDLDEDLLGLVTTKKAPEDSDSDSDLSVAGSDEDSGSDEPVGKTKQPLKKRKVAAKKSVKTVSSDEESDDEEQGYDDGYGDDLIGDTEDRARLDAMTVIEREMELSDRADARKKLEERREFQRSQRARKKKQQQAEDKPAKKMAAGLTRQRSHRRQALAKSTAATGAAKAAADLRNRRKISALKDSDSEDEVEVDDSESEAEIDDESGEDSGRRRRGGALRDESDDEEIELEEFNGKKQYKNPTSLTLSAFQNMVLTRDNLAKLVNEPTFEEAVVGMFVRLSIGLHEETQSKQYRACEIKAVVRGSKAYTVDQGRKDSKTFRKLLLAFGSHTRYFAMNMVSGAPVMNIEFLRWKKEIEKDDLEIICCEAAQDRLANYDVKTNMKYTNEMHLERQRLLRETGLTVKNAAARLKVQQEIDKAVEEGDTSAEARLKCELTQVDKELEAKWATAMDAKRMGVSAINRKNRLKNVKSTQVLGVEMPKEKDARIRTVDSNYWSVNAEPDEQEQDSTLELAAEVAASEETDELGNPTPRSVREPASNSFAAAHSELDLDKIELPELSVPLPAPSMRGPAPSSGKKKLSLADYKARRAAMTCP